MPIFLPSLPAPNGARVLLRDFGGVLTPFLGGPEQVINRLGDRFGLQVSLPPIPSGDDVAAAYVARLLRGRKSTVVMEWPLLSFKPGNPGAPKVRAATAGGTAIPVKGLTPGYKVREGHFFSVIHSGQRYMYMSTGDVIADGAGNAALAIFPMLRTALAIDDVIEMAQPMIEGLVSPGDEMGWDLALEHTIGLSFTVMERA